MPLALFAATVLLTMPDTLPLRPPSIPLIAHDPYFSIWMPHETWTAADTEHWTHAPHRLRMTVRIDGTAYRVLGDPESHTAPLPQTGLTIRPATVAAEFTGAGISLSLSFLSASIATDLDKLARPLSYILWSVKSVDGTPHQVQVELHANGMIASSHPDAVLDAESRSLGELTALTFGTKSQPVLATKGDRTQIDWGHCTLAAPSEQIATAKITPGKAGEVDAVIRSTSVQAHAEPVEQMAILAYDDQESIQYFGQNLRGYWRRQGETLDALVKRAPADLSSIRKACDQFDRELLADFTAIGGPRYAELASLSYRQCVAGSKLVADPAGQPLWFPKENSSNGCLATADVIYPMSPQALLFGPSLARALVQPIMAYGGSARWPFDFAPHDLGTYPLANGQVYGGGERTEEDQMPVEESANMLILCAAIAKMEGNADYAASHWTTLTKWAEYLVAKGFNPENQLCTDDFLGHMAQNVNLSAKAILGIRSYAELCRMRKLQPEFERYRNIATEFAERWQKESDDGDHSRLSFDQPGTWSQKYNLVWDTILGYGLFPAQVKQREVANYHRHLNPFGPPIDSRGTGAKLDWNIWLATLTGDPGDFEAIMAGVYRYVDETPNRIGLGDWYDTSNGHLNFFEARPVMGAAMIPFLYRPELWTKWAKRGEHGAKAWAPIPPRPKVTTIIGAADGSVWRYTTTPPAGEWSAESYDDSGWSQGQGGFGTAGTPGARIGTTWDNADIWLRRTFELPNPVPKHLHLWLHHDDDVQVFVNGELAFKRSGWTTDYEAVPMLAGALKALRPGRNVIAVHCHQNQGGQYIDAGFVTLTPP